MASLLVDVLVDLLVLLHLVLVLLQLLVEVVQATNVLLLSLGLSSQLQTK